MDQDKSRQSIGPVRFSQELRWTPGGGGFTRYTPGWGVQRRPSYPDPV